jgi:hypothetical protein
MTEPSRRLAILLAVISLVLACASIYSVVPRIRLVEAVGLFATAFGAGASFAASLRSRRSSR